MVLINYWLIIMNLPFVFYHLNLLQIGFILNKPLEYQISDLVTEILIPFQVYNGGPVEQDNLYFIHKVPHLIDNSVEISDGIYWGGDFEKTVDLINKKAI